MFRVCHAFLSVQCRLVVTCWERVKLLALLYVMLSCYFVTFPYGVLGQVWYLIVLPSYLLLKYNIRTPIQDIANFMAMNKLRNSFFFLFLLLEPPHLIIF